MLGLFFFRQRLDLAFLSFNPSRSDEGAAVAVGVDAKQPGAIFPEDERHGAGAGG